MTNKSSQKLISHSKSIVIQSQQLPDSFARSMADSHTLFDLEKHVSLKEIPFHCTQDDLSRQQIQSSVGQDLLISINPKSAFDRFGDSLDRPDVGVIILQADPWQGCGSEIFIQMGTRHLLDKHKRAAEFNLNDRSLYLYDFNIAEFLTEFPQNIYLILNLNFFSPAEIPDLENPIPGGPQFWPGLFLLETLIKNRQVEWIDIFGFEPVIQKQSSAFILQLCRKLLVYWYNSQQKLQILPCMTKFTNN